MIFRRGRRAGRNRKTEKYAPPAPTGSQCGDTHRSAIRTPPGLRTNAGGRGRFPCRRCARSCLTFALDWLQPIGAARACNLHVRAWPASVARGTNQRATAPWTRHIAQARPVRATLPAPKIIDSAVAAPTLRAHSSFPHDQVRAGDVTSADWHIGRKLPSENREARMDDRPKRINSSWRPRWESRPRTHAGTWPGCDRRGPAREKNYLNRTGSRVREEKCSLYIM